MCQPTTPKQVKIVVQSVPLGPKDGAPCPFFKKGDEFSFAFEHCPANFCSSAFHSLFPTLRVLEMGGRHPWDDEPGVTYSCCPDAGRPVTFRLEVVPSDA